MTLEIHAMEGEWPTQISADDLFLQALKVKNVTYLQVFMSSNIPVHRETHPSPT